MSSCGCSANAYNFGTQIRFTVAFTSALTGILEDPTNVILAIQYGGNTPAQFSLGSGQVVKDSTGNYHYDYTPANGGSYLYAWEGTGAVIASTANIPFSVTDNLFG